MFTGTFAGVALIAGSILFLIAAFSPISRVFNAPEAQKRELLANGRRAWLVAQFFFAAGALVTAVGLLLTAGQLPDGGLALLAAAVVAVAAVLWSWHTYQRAVEPEAFIAGALPGWPFAVYTVATQAGLALFGLLWLRSEMAAWVGWLLVGGAALLFILYLIFKDMPPFVYYLLTLILGWMLYASG